MLPVVFLYNYHFCSVFILVQPVLLKRLKMLNLTLREGGDMRKLKRTYLRAFYFLSFTIFLLSCSAMALSDTGVEANPTYISYDFGERDEVVILGSQPLGVLLSVVPEIMKRDKILIAALKSLQLELRVLPFYSGPDINHFMTKGKVDISMAGDFPTLTIASTSNVELVAIVKRDKASVVSHNKYTTLRDLKNKRIGFPVGTSSHLGLLVALEVSDLEESHVKLVPMKINELTSALIDSKIDAFAAWEPVPTLTIAKNKNFKRISEFLNTDFLYWTGEFAKKQPEAACYILAAYLRALNWLNVSESHINQGAEWSILSTELFLGGRSKLSRVQFKQQIRKNLKLIGSAAIPMTEFADNNYFSRAFILLLEKGLLPKGSSWKRVQNNIRPNLIYKILAEPEKYKTDVFNYGLD